jgi:endonuclease YncB( thermonuclease family)
MKTISLCLSLTVPVTMVSASAEPIQPGLINVVDGDTIKANGKTIRLIGFDAPEAGSHARCEAERDLAHRATTRLAEIRMFRPRGSHALNPSSPPVSGSSTRY